MTGQRARGVAIVTGAAGGMGAPAARLLAADGWDAFVLCDVAEDRLAPIAAELRGGGARVDPLAGDIAGQAFHDDLIARLAGRPIGAVIHTAGVSPTMCGTERLLAINIDGTLRLVDAIAPHMAEGAAAVLFASMAGHLPTAAAADAAFDRPIAVGGWRDLLDLVPDVGMAYSLSKRAVRTVARRDAKRFGQRGARLVSLSPGMIDTAMGTLETNAFTRDFVAKAAIPRVAAPEELSAVAVFLCSPAASFLTGTDVLVDGGALAAMGL